MLFCANDMLSYILVPILTLTVLYFKAIALVAVTDTQAAPYGWTFLNFSMWPQNVHLKIYTYAVFDKFSLIAQFTLRILLFFLKIVLITKCTKQIMLSFNHVRIFILTELLNWVASSRRVYPYICSRDKICESHFPPQTTINAV